VEVWGAERLAHQAPQEITLLVAGAAARERPRAAARATQAAGGLGERPFPADLAQLAAVANHRRGHALVGVDRLVGEAALVAQPAVVDLVVLAREHAQHALVADRQRDIALRRAECAERPGAL